MYMGQQDLNPSQQHLELQHRDTTTATTYAETTPSLNVTWCWPALYDLHPADDVVDIDLDYASPTTSAATVSTTPSPRFDQAVPVSSDVVPTGAHSATASFLPSPASSSCFSPPPPEQLMSQAGRMIATQQQQHHPAAYGYAAYGGHHHPNNHHNPRLLDTSVGGSHHHLPRHNRDSSLSSLGSAGPASPLPYHRGTLGPQIAVADSGDGFANYGSTGFDDITNQIYGGYGSGKSVAPSPVNYIWRPQTAAVPPPPQSQPQQQQHGVMHPPKFGASRMPDQNGRGAGWGAASDDNTLAPAGAAAHNMGRKPYVHEPPKFIRTVTDAKEDALYLPLSDTPARADLHLKTPHRSTSSMAGGYDQRLQHLQPLEPSTTGMGGMPSPPDTVAPFSRTMAHGTPTNSGYRFRSLTDEPQERVHAKSEPEMGNADVVTSQPAEQPQTMSPQDAMIQYPVSNDDFNRLFDHHADFDLSGTLGLMPIDHHHRAHTFQFAPTAQLPPQRPLHPSQQQQHSPQSATHLDEVAMQDSVERPVEQFSALGPLRNPNMDSNEKTYTCTYHGCDERFDSQKDLQKHKRDAHRPPNGHQTIVRTNQLSTQAGPHRCNRINPSTNRPCNTEFSRPYDLTRHEDTMHNVSKRKYRCPYCTTDNKTFSRRDALTRHHRVAHGIDTSRRRQRQQAAAAAVAPSE